MFENPRRGRQVRNFTTNVPKILDLKSSSEQIFSRKLSLGAPDTSSIFELNHKRITLFFIDLALEECRVIQFTEKIANKALSNYVIQQKQVLDEDMCKVRCFLEPECVSFNFGQQNDGSLLCELNNRSHAQVPDAMQTRIGFIYRPVFVSTLRYEIVFR